MAKDDRKLQQFNSFNAGEYSPSLAGRTDLESFGSSARLLQNFLSEATGGIKKFYGTYHVTDLKNRSDILLIPFVNKYEPMCLVFTPEAVGIILTNDYKGLGIQPLPVSDLRSVRWKQINDKLILVSKNMPMMSIDFLGADSSDVGYSFVVNSVQLDYEPFFPIGWKGNYNGTIISKGASGEIKISIPSDMTVDNIPLPTPLVGVTRFNILGAGNTMAYGPATSDDRRIVLGQTTAVLYKKNGGERTKLAQSIISSDPVGLSWQNPYEPENYIIAG